MEIGPKSVGFELKPGCAACVGPARASLEVTAAYIILSAPSKYLGKCRFDPLVWEEGWGGTSWSLRSHRHPQMAQNNRGWRRGSSSCWGWGGGTSHSQWQESTVRARRRRRNSLQQHQWAFLGGTPPPLFLSALPSSPSAIFASLRTRSRGSEPQPGHEQCCLSNDETPRAAARVCAAQPQPRHRIPAFPTSSPNRAETGPPHASPPPKYVKKMSFPLPEPEPG